MDDATHLAPMRSPVTANLAQTAATQSILLWVAVALVVTAVGLLIGVAISVYRRSRVMDRAEPIDPAFPTGNFPEAERLLRLMGEAEELAGRLTAQLDDKARHLEHLLRQADARAAALERRTPAAPPLPHSGPQHAAPVPPSHDPRVITRPVNLATAIHGPSPIAALSGGASPIASPAAAGTGVSPTRAASAPQVSSAVDGASDPIVDAICRLADQGQPPTAIAQQLGQPIGKIELILALRQS